MRMIHVSEGEAGELAVNLELINYARYLNGVLDLHFEGSGENSLAVDGQAAYELWKEIIKKG